MGGYSVVSPPQLIRLLPIEWLNRFPDELIDRIESVLGKAVGRFKTQDELLPFLQCVIAEMTPDFPTVRRMGEIVDELLICNTRTPEDKRQLFEEIRRSPEWAALTTATATRPAPGRRERLAAFLSAIQRSEPGFSYKEFWKAVGVDPADGGRWQRDDLRAVPGTGTSNKIERALSMEPDEFVCEYKIS